MKAYLTILWFNWRNSEGPEILNTISVALTAFTFVVLVFWAIVSLLVDTVEFLALTKFVLGAVVIAIINTVRLVYVEWKEDRDEANRM